MILHIEELEVGSCYSSGGNEYLCIERTDNFAIMLNYEHSHRIASLEFWNEDTLFNIDNLKFVYNYYTLIEYLNKFQYIDNQTLILRD